MAQTKQQSSGEKQRRIRFKVGADIGTKRYEDGDTAAHSTLKQSMGPATLGAWLDQGLLEEVD